MTWKCFGGQEIDLNESITFLFRIQSNSTLIFKHSVARFVELWMMSSLFKLHLLSINVKRENEKENVCNPTIKVRVRPCKTIEQNL